MIAQNRYLMAKMLACPQSLDQCGLEGHASYSFFIVMFDPAVVWAGPQGTFTPLGIKRKDEQLLLPGVPASD
ncbi:hypothetical protein NDU88_004490 [Pleurodeles waltl]|uniref:Uncharacterized protein n=1 Tax=Pleurodeles waltl TaxID=8319 RepID=A0AAV7M8I8_PLEWA|nr:hypothetical protein NDU88_004490 [Pleurodeles waltl]